MLPTLNASGIGQKLLYYLDFSGYTLVIEVYIFGSNSLEKDAWGHTMPVCNQGAAVHMKWPGGALEVCSSLPTGGKHQPRIS